MTTAKATHSSSSPAHIHVMSAEETVGKMFILAHLCGVAVQPASQAVAAAGAPSFPLIAHPIAAGLEDMYPKTHTCTLRSLKQTLFPVSLPRLVHTGDNRHRK